MTRKLLLATTAIACLVLVGCGKEDTTGQTTSTQSTTAPDGTTTTTEATGPATDNSYTPAPGTDLAQNDTGSTGASDLGGTAAPSSDLAASTTSPDAAALPATAPTIPDTDLAEEKSALGFIQRAATSDQYEIMSSRLALTKNVSQATKDFAQMMIDTHTATSVQIKGLASNHALTVPTGLTKQQQDWLDALKGASDAEFATLYADQQVKAHTAALKLLDGYASNGNSADLKQFASTTAPKVKEHLAKAEALSKAEKTSNPS